MSRIDELKKLLAKVEAGDSSNDGTMFKVFRGRWTYCFDAYNGDLTGAKELHDAVLPEWTWRRLDNGDFLLHDEARWAIGQHRDPARAWLIAIIKALIAMEKTT